MWRSLDRLPIKVNNDNPDNIELGWGVFENVPTYTCILYVPIGCKDLYAKADQWNQFAHIEEIDFSDAGIDGILMDNDETDLSAPYYDLQGRVVSNPTHGIYIHNGKKMLIE